MERTDSAGEETGGPPRHGWRRVWSPRMGLPLALVTSCVVAAIVAVAGVGDGGRSGAPAPRGEAAVLHRNGASLAAAWAFRPKSVDDMVSRATVGGVATVAKIAAGAPLRGDEPDDVMPTQRITFRFDQRWFGSGPAELVLYKTGNNATWIEDDPPYAVGEKYVMFVSPRPEEPSTYLNVAPDGRLKVQDGRLRPLVEGAVARSLGGASVAEAEQTADVARGR